MLKRCYAAARSMVFALTIGRRADRTSVVI